MQSVVETTGYLSDAKAAGLTEAERETIVLTTAARPDAGVLIPGAGGARKLRFAGRGKGKSGGYRVVTYYGGADIPVFLLNVFAKGDKVDLTPAERNELAKVLRALAAAYREGARRHVQGRKTYS